MDALDPDLLADDLRPAILRLARRVRQQADKVGLTQQEAVLLGLIRREPGVGVSRLAELEQLSRPTVSAYIKALEARGLIQRVEDAEDGRRHGLTLTEAAVPLLEAIRTGRNDWLARRLGRLTPKERQAIAEAIAPLLRMSEAER